MANNPPAAYGAVAEIPGIGGDPPVRIRRLRTVEAKRLPDQCLVGRVRDEGGRTLDDNPTYPVHVCVEQIRLKIAPTPVFSSGWAIWVHDMH